MGDLKELSVKVKIPAGSDEVFKDECCFSFDNPESEEGLYICMNRFLAFGKDLVSNYSRRSGNKVFLKYKKIRIEKNPEVNDGEPEIKKPTRLTLGLEGGFSAAKDDFTFEEIYSIVFLPEWREIQLLDSILPEYVVQSAISIKNIDSAAKKKELEALANTWDGEQRAISRFCENLLQLETSKKTPPSGWKCEKCDKTDNLWLNLTDGSILCGRKFFDGTGGNNHAIEQYQNTHYPLAVKLGTITPTGADVYSYAEDDMVLDPYLPQHLAHFGIVIMNMKKTDKSMLEMELDLNQRAWEWKALQESGSNLDPVHGPGLTGLQNLGNSCYINSVVQMLFTIPTFIDKWYKPALSTFQEASYDNPTTNFNVQLCKLAYGLLSGKYSQTIDKVTKQEGIRLSMFKHMIGHGHYEFSTNKQQDAAEYLLHLFSIIERNCLNSYNPTNCLKFQIEDQIECSTSHQVKYITKEEYMLSLPIPMKDAINKDEIRAYEERKTQMELNGQNIDPKHAVRAIVDFSSCINFYTSCCTVEDFYSSAIKAKTTAYKTIKFKTFPDYLMIQLQKFTIGQDWVEKKLDVLVEMPDVIDISHLRGNGKQPNEQELPNEEEAGSSENVLNFDQLIVSELTNMGFSYEGCKKAAYFTKGKSLDAAVNWVMEHMDDPDFEMPFIISKPYDNSTFMADQESLSTIMGMGFSHEQALQALKSTDNNLERSVDWIFSHINDLPTVSLPQDTSNILANPNLTDGHGKYKLVSFISHMGNSSKFGHYVCHILNVDKWILFNDEKVALSENPPKSMGYIYLYKRLSD